MYTSKFSPRSSSPFVFKGRRIHKIVEVSKGDYVRNAFGFIRSDFAELQASQDSMNMARVLQKMQEISSNEPDNSNKTFEEIVAMVRPRWCQSPAELDRFELYCIDNALDTYAKLKKLDDEQKEALAKAKQKQIDEIKASIKSESVDTPSNQNE